MLVLSAGKFHERCLHNFEFIASLGSFLIQFELKKNVNKGGKITFKIVLTKRTPPPHPQKKTHKKTRAHINNLKQDYGVGGSIAIYSAVPTKCRTSREQLSTPVHKNYQGAYIGSNQFSSSHIRAQRN